MTTPAGVRRTDTAGVSPITAPPSRSTIAWTYTRLPPVTVRQRGEWRTVNMPWLAKKRIR
jgi:hypothetical protein